MRKRRENCRKKVPELFGSCLEKSLSLHPLRERNTARKRQKQVLKKFRNPLEIQKNDLPLHPLRMQHTVRNDTKKGSEKFFQKDLVVRK